MTDFDRYMLVPKRGVLKSRADADICGRFVRNHVLDVPIISANMPSVTGPTLAVQMYRAGGYGVLHRFNTIEENVDDYNLVRAADAHCACSIGLKDGIERACELVSEGCNEFVLDTAHGDSGAVEKFVCGFRVVLGNGPMLIAGNVASGEAAQRLIHYGADGIKVGIGPGTVCTTRVVTGFGVPQLQAIHNVRRGIDEYFKFSNEPPATLVADGGIRSSGDIVKALAAGADTVMIGGLLAATDEAPGGTKFWGNASKRMNGHRAPEGIEVELAPRGRVEDVMKELAWGIRSGVSYGGGVTLADLRRNAEWVEVK